MEQEHIQIRIYKQFEMAYSTYVIGDAPAEPLGVEDMIEVELTESEFYQLVEDEREGRITFEDIKAKYTKNI